MLSDELKESLRGKEMQIHSLKEEMRRLKLQYESDTDQMYVVAGFVCT